MRQAGYLAAEEICIEKSQRKIGGGHLKARKLAWPKRVAIHFKR